MKAEESAQARMVKMVSDTPIIGSVIGLIITFLRSIGIGRFADSWANAFMFMYSQPGKYMYIHSD